MGSCARWGGSQPGSSTALGLAPTLLCLWCSLTMAAFQRTTVKGLGGCSWWPNANWVSSVRDHTHYPFLWNLIFRQFLFQEPSSKYFSLWEENENVHKLHPVITYSCKRWWYMQCMKLAMILHALSFLLLSLSLPAVKFKADPLSLRESWPREQNRYKENIRLQKCVYVPMCVVMFEHTCDAMCMRVQVWASMHEIMVVHVHVWVTAYVHVHTHTIVLSTARISPGLLEIKKIRFKDQLTHKHFRSQWT